MVVLKIEVILHYFFSQLAAAPGDYHTDEVLAPRPAAAMSEYELESVFRQLREYSSLYKDMINNYNHLMKRLKEEDARRSGNFALKRPHLPGKFSIGARNVSRSIGARMYSLF